MKAKKTAPIDLAIQELQAQERQHELSLKSWLRGAVNYLDDMDLDRIEGHAKQALYELSAMRGCQDAIMVIEEARTPKKRVR